MVKFILQLSSDNVNDGHKKAVVELTPENAGVLLRMRDVFNAASLVSPVTVDQIDFIGPVGMRVVAIAEDCDKNSLSVVNAACRDHEADICWTEDELNYNVARTELNRVSVCDVGVQWSAYLESSNTKLLSAYLPWKMIERVSRGELP